MNETIKAQYVLGTIRILRQHNFELFYPPTQYVSINTVLNFFKTGHFLDPPIHFSTDVIS